MAVFTMGQVACSRAFPEACGLCVCLDQRQSFLLIFRGYFEVGLQAGAFRRKSSTDDGRPWRARNASGVGREGAAWMIFRCRVQNSIPARSKRWCGSVTKPLPKLMGVL